MHRTIAAIVVGAALACTVSATAAGAPPAHQRAPRLPSQVVPRSAGILEVTQDNPDSNHLAIDQTVTGPKVGRIARLIDDLPVAKPSADLHCGDVVPISRTDTFTFRARAGGPVLARLTGAADALSTRDLCGTMTLHVAGRHAVQLYDGGRLLHRAGSILGLRLFRRASFGGPPTAEVALSTGSGRHWWQRVPPAARTLTVTQRFGDQPRTIDRSARGTAVTAIAQMVDRLPLARRFSAPVPCPFIPATAVDRFAFRARAGGPVVARVTASAATPTTPSPCTTITLRVGSHAPVHLLSGGRLLHGAGSLLGVTLVVAPGTPGPQPPTASVR